MSVFPFDLHFFKHRELNTVVPFTKLLDFRGSPWFLPAKLVAGKTENDEASLLESVIELLQFPVLRRKSALTAVLTISSTFPAYWSRRISYPWMVFAVNEWTLMYRSPSLWSGIEKRPSFV